MAPFLRSLYIKTDKWKIRFCSVKNSIDQKSQIKNDIWCGMVCFAVPFEESNRSAKACISTAWMASRTLSRNLTIMEFGAAVTPDAHLADGRVERTILRGFFSLEATVNLTCCDMFKPPWMMSKCKTQCLRYYCGFLAARYWRWPKI